MITRIKARFNRSKSKKRQIQIEGDTHETVISSGSSFKGTISGEGSIRVRGSVEGRISNQGALMIDSNGIVKGNVSSQDVIIEGCLDGNVTASIKTKVLPKGQITGDINCQTISVGEGANLGGRTVMKTGPDKA